MKTIKELVLSAKNGNKKAFDKLYKLTSNDVWFTCLSLLKDEENAKDIMQETYITAFCKLDTLNDEQKFQRLDYINSRKQMQKQIERKGGISD